MNNPLYLITALKSGWKVNGIYEGEPARAPRKGKFPPSQSTLREGGLLLYPRWRAILAPVLDTADGGPPDLDFVYRGGQVKIGCLIANDSRPVPESIACQVRQIKG